MKTYNVLFLCVGNSARSIIAEALLNFLSKGRFKAYSAGSRPSGQVNPFAAERLATIGYPVSELRSKSWDEFAVAGAPQMDFVITVCSESAGEGCPVWPGQPMTAHWGFEDPVSVTGTDDEKRRAFNAVFVGLQKRIELMLALPIEGLDKMALQKRVQDIHHNEQA